MAPVELQSIDSALPPGVLRAPAEPGLAINSALPPRVLRAPAEPGLAIEIDRCPACGGIVLDKGESEMIDALGLAQVIEGGVSAEHAHERVRATAARCHECARDMIALRGAGDVEYDWCDGCERLFFDRGELTAFDSFVDA